MKKSLLVLSAALLAVIAFAQPAEWVSAGSVITVRTDDFINARSVDGRVYRGTVNEDVVDSQGRLAIPRGALVELMARRASGHDIVLDLESVDVRVQRYTVRADSEEVRGEQSRRDGVGANGRTGKFVGGGAILGTIVGAIAGGGKGAAIGALAGAGAGATTQIATRGRNVYIPAETLLTFRLERALAIGPADNGYDRDGRHYHRYDR